jgi:autotransporter translocation and assembly factor TamB
MKSIIKKAIISLIVGLGAIILTLQIPKVNSLVVQGLFNVILPSSYRVSIDTIKGAFPFEITIKKMTFYDKQGKWLKLKDVRYSWRGIDIFLKKINFDYLKIDKVKLYRTSETLASTFQISDHFPIVNIRKFKIKDLSVYDRARLSIKAQLTTPETDHHYITAQIWLPHGKDKVVEVTGSLIKEQVSIAFSLQNPISDIVGLFPAIQNQVQGGHITTEFEFYSNRKFQEISSYFSGHIHDLKSPHTFVREVIGSELEWTINTNFKPREDHYRLVGKVISSCGVHSTWDALWKPFADKIEAQVNFKIPKIRQFQLLPDDYGGDIDLTAIIENKVVKWKIAGLTHLNNKIPPSEGEITIYHLQPYLDFHFKAQLHGPGIAPHISGHWFGDMKGWNIQDGHIHDRNIDFRFNYQKDRELTGNLEGHVKDLSVFNLLTGLNLVGESWLTCQINKGQGDYKFHWSHGQLVGTINGSMALMPEQKSNKILVKDLKLSKQNNLFFFLNKAWEIQLDTQGIAFNQASFKVGDGQLELKNGHFAESVDGHALLKNLPIKTLHLLGIEGDYEGMIQGEVNFRGTKEKPEFIGHLKFEKISFPDENRKRTKFFDASVNLERHQEKYQLKLEYHDSMDSELSAKGYLLSHHFIPNGSDPLDISISGNYNISILNALLKRSDRLKGSIHLSAKVSGSLNSPHLAGKINLDDGIYENGELGLLIQKISLVGRLHNNELTIDKFHGHDVDTGTATGSGYIKLVELNKPQIQFNVLLNNLIIANSDLLLIRAGGNLQINQEKQNPLIISGKLTVNSADAFLADTAPRTKLIRIRNNKDLKDTGLPKKYSQDQSKKTKFGQLKISVDIPQKLFIRGYGVASQWKGGIRIEGAINEPQINGTLTLIRGQVEVVGKILPLIEGRINFTPARDEIDPVLHIIAGKMINDVKTMIKIEGPSSRPETAFLSIPVLPQEEVVSLILFGKPLNSVTAAQSLKLATAIASIKASGSRGRSITERIRTDFGLDEIGIQGEDNSEDNNSDLTSGYSLHVGKQLTDRAYIALKQGLKGETGTDVILRYDLTEHAKAEFEAGTGRHANSGGLSWEKRY